MKPSRGKARGFDTTTLLRCFLLFFHPLATCNSLFVRTKRRKMANPYKANLSGCSCTLTQLCYFSFFFFSLCSLFSTRSRLSLEQRFEKEIDTNEFFSQFCVRVFLKIFEVFPPVKTTSKLEYKNCVTSN